MSSKPLINYFNKIGCFNKDYPAFTNAVRVYEDNDETYAIVSTDNLEINVFKYSPTGKKYKHYTECFKLGNGDNIYLTQTEMNDVDKFCEAVVMFLVERTEHYKTIHDKKGFIKIVKTRKAILSRDSTYFSHGLNRFTISQRDEKNAAKIENADVALNNVNISRTNPIPGAISTMLNVIYDSVSCVYRKPYFIPTNDSKYISFKAPFIEWLNFDVPKDVLYGAYEMISNILENGRYPFDEYYF